MSTYTDAYRIHVAKKTLASAKHSRQWVYDFLIEHVNPDYKQPPDSDPAFIRAVRQVQIFVYGDAGDAAMGVPKQPATEAEVDGILGSGTLRRMETYLESLTGVCTPDSECTTVDYLVVSGKRIPVDNVRIVSFDEPKSLSFHRECPSCYSKWLPKHIKNLLATVHWDAALSAKSCFNILKNRNLSSTLGIDNPLKDGMSTVYQWMDPGPYYGHHAGDANRRSAISIDLSNAVYTKYAAKYKKEVGIERPVIQVQYHGAKKTILGMYKGQILAMLRILKALSEYFKLPFVFPADGKGNPVTTLLPGALDVKQYQGCVTHLHLSKNKFDVAGLEYQIVALLLSDDTLMKEFPSLVECFRLHDPHWTPWLDSVLESWTWDELWG